MGGRRLKHSAQGVRQDLYIRRMSTSVPMHTEERSTDTRTHTHKLEHTRAHSHNSSSRRSNNNVNMKSMQGESKIISAGKIMAYASRRNFSHVLTTAVTASMPCCAWEVCVVRSTPTSRTCDVG